MLQDQVKQVVADHEVHSVRQSSAVLLIDIVVLQAIFLLVIIALGFLLSLIGLSLFSGIFFIIFLTLLVVDVYLTINRVLNWKTYYYVIKPKAVLVKSGILHKREKLYTLNQIDTITVVQSFMGRRFGYGDVKIYSPTLVDRLILHNIPNPKDIERLILTDLPESQQPNTTEPKAQLIDIDPLTNPAAQGNY